MTDAREKALERVSYIYYPIQFKKDVNKTQVQALIDSKIEVNAIHPTFAKGLGLPIRLIEVGAQKIDGTTLDTYGIVVAAFLVTDKANQVRFFEETFLVANVSLKVVFGMLFLTLNSADVDFSDQKLWWRTYITKETFSTIGCVKLVGKIEFAAAVLNLEHEIFVVHIALLLATSLSSTSLNANI